MYKLPNLPTHAFENLVRPQLRSLGYYNIHVNKEDLKSRTFDVTADGRLRRIFLRVLVKNASEHSTELSHKQISQIKQAAELISKEPWTAILSLNERGELTDKIYWKDLSKHSA